MDKQRNDAQYEEMNRLYQNLQAMTNSIKAELMAKMKEHRDEYLSIFNQSEEERQRSEKIKFEK